jgi:hypothetical protein
VRSRFSTRVACTDRDLSTSKARAGIETDTIPASAAVNLNFAGVGLEALRGVLGGDTALDSKAALSHGLLRETELRQSSASSDLDLSGNDVDARDLL